MTEDEEVSLNDNITGVRGDLREVIERLDRRSMRNIATNVVIGVLLAAVIVLGALFYVDQRADDAEDCSTAREARGEMELLLVGLAAERPHLVEAVHDYYDGLPEPGACT